MPTNQFRKRDYERNDEEDNDQPPKNRPFQPREIDYYHDLAVEKQTEEGNQEYETPAVSVVSPYEKCSYCNMAGHEVGECRYRIMSGKAEAKRAEVKFTPPRKCEMCNGPHVTQGCHIVAPYREPRQVEGENEEIFYLINGKLCDDYEEKYMEPQVAETVTKKQCTICYEEHRHLCPYRKAVKKGALISPFFRVYCRKCNDALDKKNFWCSRCKKEMIGYVIACSLCKVCGKRNLSPNCCPYGRLIFDNFRTSHPSGNGKLWPWLEDHS